LETAPQVSVYNDRFGGFLPTLCQTVRHLMRNDRATGAKVSADLTVSNHQITRFLFRSSQCEDDAVTQRWILRQIVQSAIFSDH
jgi:hypothetical protein